MSTTTQTGSGPHQALPAVRALLVAINTSDLDTLGDLVTADFVDHEAPLTVPPGPEGYRRTLSFVTGVLGIRYEVCEQIVTPDRVVVRASAHGRGVAAVHGRRRGRQAVHDGHHARLPDRGPARRGALGRPRRAERSPPARCAATPRGARAGTRHLRTGHRVRGVDDDALAADLVREAGSLAAKMLDAGLDTHFKTSISDVVSAADHAAEALVAGRLAAERGHDGLVGEEGARSTAESGRTWYIDPVDGTYNFLSGIPYWCSAVGLVDDAGPLLGAVYYPARDELWVGGRDRPTTLNGRPLAPLPERPLAEVSVATYSNGSHLRDVVKAASWNAATGAAATTRMFGSASVDLAGVATGRIGVFLQANLHPWDWYPGAALVIGAGGLAEEVVIGSQRWLVAGNAQAVAETRAALVDGAAAAA